jgi:hypothetical protein
MATGPATSPTTKEIPIDMADPKKPEGTLRGAAWSGSDGSNGFIHRSGDDGGRHSR